MSIHYTYLGQELMPVEMLSPWNHVSKMRYDCRDKSYCELNSKPNKLQLISFDDTNMIPVVKLEDHMMNILLNWYDKCDSLLDIVDIDFEIPENIKQYELYDVLYKPFNKNNIVCFKDNFLPKYIELINDKQQVNKLKNELYNNGSEQSSNIPKKREKTLADLGIVENEVEKEKGVVDATFKENIVEPHNKPLNYQIIIEDDNDKDDNEKNVYVLIHTYYLQTIVLIEPTQNEIDLFKYNTEYGFIQLLHCVTNNEHIIDGIQTTYKNRGFDNACDVTKSLELINKIIDTNKTMNKTKKSSKSEETIIKKHIIDNYKITQDVDNRIKASTLLNTIVEFVFNFEEILGKEHLTKVHDYGFKIRLAKYLTDLGLQKKRYNDGYYYYGIVKKEVSFVETNNSIKKCIDNRTNRTINDLLYEREQPINAMEIFNNKYT